MKRRHMELWKDTIVNLQVLGVFYEDYDFVYDGPDGLNMGQAIY